MSTTIDRRIVEMQFDNKQFEEGIKDSIKSLEELKDSLELEDSSQALVDFAETSSSAFDQIQDDLEKVANKFSFFGGIIDKITNGVQNLVINAGKKISSELGNYFGMGAMKSGFTEYETQMNAVQTILANTSDYMKKSGMTDEQRLAKVNEKLAELNTYADKTIYNFTEMTNNIGRFTAAGIDLDKATTAIQGISNLAAVSGATSNQATTAMVQLSQALATGKLMLQDYSSLVTAGMGGEVFQKAMIRNAERMGKTIEVTDKATKKVVKKSVSEIIEMEGSFRESLKYGWADQEVMMRTFEQMSWDFESIAKANQITVEEAKDMKRAELRGQEYTEEEIETIISLAEEATDAATKVKTLTQLFDTLKEAAQSGWTTSWQLIVGDFEEAKDLFTGVSDFFGKILEDSSDTRNKIIEDWRNSGGRDALFSTDQTTDINGNSKLGALFNILYGLKNIVSIVADEFRKLFPKKLGSDIADTCKRIQELTANFLKFTKNEKIMGKFRAILNTIFTTVRHTIDAIGFVVKKVINWVSILITFIKNGFDFSKISERVQAELKKTTGAFDWVKQRIRDFFVGISKWFQRIDFGTIWTNIKNNFAELKKWFLSLDFEWLWSNAKNKWNDIKNWFFGINFNWLWDSIKSKWESLKNWFLGLDFSSIWTNIKNVWGNVRNWFINLDYGWVWSSIRSIWKNIGDWITNLDFSEIWKNAREKLGSIRTWVWELLAKSEFVKKFSGIWDTIRSFVSRIVDRFNTVKQKIIGLFRGTEEESTSTVEKAWNGIKSIFSSASHKIANVGRGIKGLFKFITGGDSSDEDNAFTRLKKKIEAFLQSTPLFNAAIKLFEKVRNRLDGVKKWFSKLGDGWLGTNLKSAWENVKTWFIGVRDWIAGIDFGPIKQKFQSIWEAIKGWFSNVDYAAIWDRVKSVWERIKEWFSDLAGDAKEGDENSVFVNPFDAIKDKLAGLWESIKTIIENIKTWVTTALSKFEGVNFTKIGTTVIKLYSFIRRLLILKDITNVTGAFKDIAAGFKSLGKSSKTWAKTFKSFLKGDAKISLEKVKKETDSIGTTLLKIAGSILLIVASIYVISKINDADLQKGLIVVGGIAVALLALVFILKKIGDVDATPFLHIGGAVLMITAAIFVLSRMEWNDIGKGLLAVGAILLELAIFTRLTSKKNMTKGLISAAVALLIMTITLKRVAKMSNKDLKKGLIGLGAMLLEVAIFTRLASKRKAQMAGLISLAASMLILVISLKKIADMKPEQLKQGLVGLGLLLLEVAVFTRLASKKSTQMAGTIALALAMLMLTNVVKQLGEMDYESLKQGLIALGVALLEVSVLMGRMKGGSILSALATILLLKGVFDIFTQAFKIVQGYGMTPQDFEDMKTFAEGTAILLAGTAGAMKIISGINFTRGLEGIGTFAAMITALGALIVAFGAIRDGIGAESLDEWFESGATVMEQIGVGLGKLINGFISAALGMDDGFHVNFSLAGLGSDLSAFMTNSQDFIDGCKKITESALAGAGRLAGMILAIGGAEFLAALGSIFTGRDLFASFETDVTYLAKGTKAYAEEVKGFTELASTEDLNLATETATSLANVMKAIPWTGGWIQDVLGGPNMELFSSQIPKLGLALITYARMIRGISDIPEEDFSRSVNLATSLNDIYKALPWTGGIIQEWLGGPDLALFSTQIPILGVGVKSYARSIKGINSLASNEDADMANSISSSISAIYHAIPWTGGKLQEWLGGPNIGDFAAKMPILGSGLQGYATNISGFTTIAKPEDLTRSIEIADSIAEIFKKLPWTDGTWQEAFGGPNLSTFAHGIGDLGWGLREYILSIAGISTGNMNNITKTQNGIAMVGELGEDMTNVTPLTDADIKVVNSALSGIAELTQTMGSTETWNWFSGEKKESLKSFGEGVKYITEGMATYAASVPGISKDKLTDEDIAIVGRVLDGFLELDTKLPTKTWSEGWNYIQREDMATFGIGIKNLATGLGDYITNVSGLANSGKLSEEDNQAAISALEGIVELDAKLPVEAWSKGWGFISEKKENLSTFGQGVVELSTGLVSFVTNLTGIKDKVDDDDMSTALNVADKLSEIDAKLPWNSSGFGALFAKKEGLTDFGKNLGGLASGIVDYVTILKTGDIGNKDNKEHLSTAVGVAENLRDIDNSLPWQAGPITALLFGKETLSEFSTNIPKLATALVSFVEELGTTDLGRADTAVSILDRITEIFKKLEPGSPFSVALQALVGIDVTASATASETILQSHMETMITIAGQLRTFIDAITGAADDLAEGEEDTAPDLDAGTTAVNIIDKVVEIFNKIKEKNGLLETIQDWFDPNKTENTLISYVSALSTLAGDLTNFVTTVTTISDENLAKVLSTDSSNPTAFVLLDTIVDFMGQMEAKLTDVWDVVGTANTLKTYTSTMRQAAAQLKTFIFIVSGFNDTGMSKLLPFDDTDGVTFKLLDRITDFMIQLEGKTSNKSILDWMKDMFSANGGSPGQTLISYTTDMITVGENLATFVTKITDVKYDKGTEDTFTILTTISDFMKQIDQETDGFSIMSALGKMFGWEKDSAEKTLIDYTEAMVTVGSNLSDFATKVKGVRYEDTEGAEKTLQGIVNVMSGYFVEGEDMFVDMGTLSENMATFGNNFAIFAVGLDTAQSAFANWNLVMQLIGSLLEYMGELHTKIDSGEIDLATLYDTIYNLSIYALQPMVSSFTAAIQNGEIDIATAARNLSIAGSNALNEKPLFVLWQLAGGYLASGLEYGINQHLASVAAVANNMGVKTYETLKTVWAIRSPSRVGMELGMYFDLGIANGLYGYAEAVADSAEHVGKSALDSAKTMLLDSNTSIFDNIDPNPSIRPVLDLSNVRSGFGAIDGMFASERTLGAGMFQDLNFMNGTEELNFDGARIVGGLSNNDVVSELQELEERFAELGEQVGNMQLVLDTGALVGGTSAKMDTELGMMAMRKGRGN